MEKEGRRIQEGDLTMEADVRVTEWVALKMEKGATREETQVASRNGKGKAMDSSLESPEGAQPS